LNSEAEAGAWSGDQPRVTSAWSAHARRAPCRTQRAYHPQADTWGRGSGSLGGDGVSTSGEDGGAGARPAGGHVG